MELDTVTRVVAAFYRLLGTESGDPALIEHGESQDDVAYLFLTRGCRVSQRWMLSVGYDGWRKLSPALTWSGSDATTGGQYTTLPTDFLRAYGGSRLSALVQANGDHFGREIIPQKERERGNNYYFRGTQLWLTRNAVLPSGALFLDYHYTHPKWSSTLGDANIDFPMDARPLIVATAAALAKEDNWLPGGPDMEGKIERALARAREEARDVARPSKRPRQFRRALRFGNHW